MIGILRFGFLLMGFSFTVTQGLLIREFLVAYFGNELSIGLILGNWLVLEAVGSGLLGRLADRWRSKARSYALLQILFALFLPLCLYAVYNSRRIVGAIPGEGVGLIPIFTASFLVLIPLAVVDGAMFAFGSRAYATIKDEGAAAIGWVYVYEALGAITGGLLFTFLFIPFLDSLHVVLLLCGLNLLSAVLILAWPKRRRWRVVPGLAGLAVLLIAGLGVLLSLRAEEVRHWVAGRQWAGQDLVYSENSVYGKVAVVQRESQYTFYADGIPILTAPVPDLVLSEEIVHLPMLFVPQQRRALVLSGGLGGVLRELAKYPVEAIDYAELDPLLIEAVRAFPTPLTVGELSDPRLKVRSLDGRLLIRRQNWGLAPRPDEGYDLITVNLPYPSTLQLNRFYTLEFHRMVNELLADEGVLVIGCPGTLTYMSEELRDLNLTAYRTLQEVYPGVRPIPGELNLWLASRSDTLLTTPVDTLVERWEKRGLETQLMTDSHIRLKLAEIRLDWFWTALLGRTSEGEGRLVGSADEHVNRDFRPVGLLYGLSYWNALFSPDTARVLAFASSLNLRTLSLAIIGSSLVVLGVVRLTKKGRRAVVPIVIATTGFAGMAADLLIIFSFQTLYGFVYHWVTLLITAFMAGLSLGGLLMTRRLHKTDKVRPVILRLDLAMVVYWILLPITLNILYSHVTYPLIFTAIQGLLLLLNAVAGFLVGSQFPVASRMWLEDREAVGGTAGVLYACDLIGAFLGAVILSVVLVPVLGIFETCILAALLKSGSLLLMATSSKVL